MKKGMLLFIFDSGRVDDRADGCHWTCDRFRLRMSLVFLTEEQG